MNTDFTFINSTRARQQKDGTVEEYPVLLVAYKGEALAIFSGENLRERAEAYIKTYGYLAEWRRRILTGEGTSWDDSLFVNIE